MHHKLKSILHSIEHLTASETGALRNALAERFEINNDGPIIFPASIAPAEAVETFYDVILDNAGPSKMGVLKAIREILGLSLVEAKSLVDSTPKTIKDGVDSIEAEAIKQKLVSLGGVVTLKAL